MLVILSQRWSIGSMWRMYEYKPDSNFPPHWVKCCTLTHTVQCTIGNPNLRLDTCTHAPLHWTYDVMTQTSHWCHKLVLKCSYIIKPGHLLHNLLLYSGSDKTLFSPDLQQWRVLEYICQCYQCCDHIWHDVHMMTVGPNVGMALSKLTSRELVGTVLTTPRTR